MKMRFVSRPGSIPGAYFVYEVNAMTLWMQIMENAKFVGMCVLIIAALGVVAKYSEKFLPEKRTVSTARRVSIIGICSAIAMVLHVLDFPCCSWRRNSTNWTSLNCRCCCAVST